MVEQAWFVGYVIVGWKYVWSDIYHCVGLDDFHTKKLTRNVGFIIGCYVANIISQIWVAHDQPRYYSVRIVQIVIAWVGTPAILIIRVILSRRNKEWREWIAEQETLGNDGEGYVEQLDDMGNLVQEKVDVALLDLTDSENKCFIYPL